MTWSAVGEACGHYFQSKLLYLGPDEYGGVINVILIKTIQIGSTNPHQCKQFFIFSNKNVPSFL